MRALESLRAKSGGGRHGDTRIFITPGFAFAHVDLLVTNFHLPKITLMMLVSAPSRATNTIDGAVSPTRSRERYRFFSYGDAMLLARKH